MNFSKLKRKKAKDVASFSNPTSMSVRGPPSGTPLPILPTNDDVPKTSSQPRVLHQFRHAVEINDVALSRDASYFAVASDDPGSVAAVNSNTAPNAPVLVYEVSSKSLRSVVSAHKSSVQAVDLTLDAAFGVSADFAGLIVFWDAATGARRATLLGHRRTVTDVTVLPHGDLVISTGVDASVRLWDVDTETCKRNLSANVSIVASGVSADGNLISCACTDSTVRLWDARVARELQNPLSHDGVLTDCAMTPDGSVIASTSEAGVLTLWDVGKRCSISTQKPGGRLFGCAVTPNASRVVVTGDRGLALFSDVSHSDKSSTADFTRLKGHDSSLRVRRCAINNDGTVAVTGGYDHIACLHSLPQVNQDALLGHRVVVAPLIENMTETETLFFAFVNDGVTLQPTAVARAIDIDFNMKAVTRLSAIYIGHLCVRTLLGNGVMFSDKDLGGRTESSSFFYRKLYHKMSELVQSQRSYDFAVKILHDARKHSILSSYDVNSILGDALSNEYTRELFSQLATIISQVYSEVSARISKMETRIVNLSDKVGDLKAHLDDMKIRKVKEAKVQRYVSLVKFGLSLIPIFGSAAMAFVDSSVDIVMSLDLESLASIGIELFSTTTDFAIDEALERRQSKMSRKNSEGAERDIWAVEIAQHVLSDGFLGRLLKEDREGLEKGLEVVFDRPFKVLKRNVNSIISEYLEDATETSVKDPQVNVDTNAVLMLGNLDRSEIDLTFSNSFQEWSGDNGVLSLRQACRCLLDTTNEVTGELDAGISDAVSSYVSSVFLAETRDNIYSLVNEAIFVKVGSVVSDGLRYLLSLAWGEHFNKASLGDDVIYGSVAKRLIIGVFNISSGSLTDQIKIAEIEKEIGVQIGDNEEVNCFNFTRVAALATLRRQSRLPFHKFD